MRKSYLLPGAIALTMALGACSADEPAPENSISEDADAQENMDPPPPQDEVAETPGAQPAPSDASSSDANGDGKTTQRLSFDPGASSSRVSGSITGYETMNYLLNVRSGQSINVSMATANNATYFNIVPPGEDTASYNGSINGNMYEGVAKKSGDYRIEVYMMRSAARRDEKADFSLEVAVD